MESSDKAEVRQVIAVAAAVVLTVVAIFWGAHGCNDTVSVECPDGTTITSKGIPEGNTYKATDVALLCGEQHG